MSCQCSVQFNTWIIVLINRQASVFHAIPHVIYPRNSRLEFESSWRLYSWVGGVMAPTRWYQYCDPSLWGVKVPLTPIDLLWEVVGAIYLQIATTFGGWFLGQPSNDYCFTFWTNQLKRLVSVRLYFFVPLFVHFPWKPTPVLILEVSIWIFICTYEWRMCHFPVCCFCRFWPKLSFLFISAHIDYHDLCHSDFF